MSGIRIILHLDASGSTEPVKLQCGEVGATKNLEDMKDSLSIGVG